MSEPRPTTGHEGLPRPLEELWLGEESPHQALVSSQAAWAEIKWLKNVAYIKNIGVAV